LQCVAFKTQLISHAITYKTNERYHIILSQQDSNDNNDKNDKNKNEILNHSGGFSASRGSKILGVLKVANLDSRRI
jgi:hypothetical protein